MIKPIHTSSHPSDVVNARHSESRNSNGLVAIATAKDFLACLGMNVKVLLASLILTVLIVSQPAGVSGQERVHPKFAKPSVEQINRVFRDYEERGRSGDKVSFGVTKTIKLSTRGVMDSQPVTLIVEFMPPLAQVQKWGYEFGVMSGNATREDRKAMLEAAKRDMEKEQRVVFALKLESRSDWETPLPPLAFELVNEKGISVQPISRATLECPPTDVSCQVAMLEQGTSLIFPLYLNSGGKPFITDKMKTLKLVIKIGETTDEVEYTL